MLLSRFLRKKTDENKPQEGAADPNTFQPQPPPPSIQTGPQLNRPPNNNPNSSQSSSPSIVTSPTSPTTATLHSPTQQSSPTTDAAKQAAAAAANDPIVLKLKQIRATLNEYLKKRDYTAALSLLQFHLTNIQESITMPPATAESIGRHFQLQIAFVSFRMGNFKRSADVIYLLVMLLY